MLIDTGLNEIKQQFSQDVANAWQRGPNVSEYIIIKDSSQMGLV